MSNGVKDLRSLPLFEIIGAPMIAIIQAQTQAARATVEFIEKVGFAHEAGKQASSELDMGSLRMAEFRFTKSDEKGAEAQFIARIPILSLVAIPGVQVKDAKISFVAKITDVFEEDSASAQSHPSNRPSWLKPSLTNFRGSLAPAAKRADSSEARGDFELKIDIELEQMPIASGLEKILNMMDLAIRDKQEKVQKESDTEVIEKTLPAKAARKGKRERR
jgi:hypothetical protein